MHTSSLTIRLPDDQRERLKEAAKRLKKSESDIIRDLISRELQNIAFGERATDFIGCLESDAGSGNTFRESIGKNNRRT